MVPGSTELIIVLIIIVLLFGSKKIPELAKGIGSGIKNFKAEMNSIDDEKKDENKVVENKTETQTPKQEEKKEA